MNTALLFAAGRGLRLRPLTDTIPKPLCTINGIALIDYHLEKLADSPIQRVLINHAYLGDKIKRHIHQKQYQTLEIIYIPEPPGGLHTGGTLINALPLLGDTPFLAINADIFTDYDFSKITCPENSLAHLVLIEKPAAYKTADFGLSHEKQLCNTPADYTFSGIACYHPDLFKQKTGGRTSLIPWLRDAADNKTATGEVHTGLWFDTGTPERIQKAETAVKQN